MIQQWGTQIGGFSGAHVYLVPGITQYEGFVSITSESVVTSPSSGFGWDRSAEDAFRELLDAMDITASGRLRVQFLARGQVVVTRAPLRVSSAVVLSAGVGFGAEAGFRLSRTQQIRDDQDVAMLLDLALREDEE